MNCSYKRIRNELCKVLEQSAKLQINLLLFRIEHFSVSNHSAWKLLWLEMNSHRVHWNEYSIICSNLLMHSNQICLNKSLCGLWGMKLLGRERSYEKTLLGWKSSVKSKKQTWESCSNCIRIFKTHVGSTVKHEKAAKIECKSL